MEGRRPAGDAGKGERGGSGADNYAISGRVAALLAAREQLSGTSICHLALGIRTGKFPSSVSGGRNKSNRALALISSIGLFTKGVAGGSVGGPGCAGCRVWGLRGVAAGAPLSRQREGVSGSRSGDG